MQGVDIIREGSVIYAIVVRQNVRSEGKYNFLTPEDFPFQLGANFYASGEPIRRHFHPDKAVNLRTVNEFIVVSRGKLKVSIYNDDQQVIREEVMNTGDMILLTAGGHGFEVLEDTSIVEVKQGPYAGTEDKTFF